MNSSRPWYALAHPEKTDSPALLVYPERIRHNINEILRIAGNPGRLMPHVKTIKMPEIVKMQQDAGIQQFKCATIAEAEMLAKMDVERVLIAYPLHEPKAKRLLQLIKKYPKTHFASLIDNIGNALMLNERFKKEDRSAHVYIDIDNGMHRTGFPITDDLIAFYKEVHAFPNIHVKGLHVYDGHLHDPDPEFRKKHCDAGFEPVKNAVKALQSHGFKAIEIVAGGSPTFAFHAGRPDVICSPGTTLLWDAGYQKSFPELPFLPAAVLLTRIISIPQKDRFTTDLGHKSVAAENPVDKRIFFLNLKGYKVSSQSEEHLVVQSEDAFQFKTGDVLYGIPYHICPTVALYDEVQVVEKGEVTAQWKVTARVRKINI